jgi:hypothetical protein
MHKKLLAGCAIAGAISPLAVAQQVQVIYSKVDASPTSDIAGTLDLAGMPAASKWRALEDFTVRPDGGDWVVKGRTRLGSDLETILVRGAGASGTMFCQEGQPFQGAAAGELYDFFDTPSPVSYDAAGNIGFSARARGGVTADNEKVIVVSTLGVHTQVLQQGDAYLGLMDVPANPTGDEIVGNSIGSVQLLDNGEVFFGNTPIGNCHSSRYPAIFRGNTGFRQSGVSAIGGETWDSFDFDGCGGSSNPAFWFAVGDTENTNTAIDRIMVVNDAVVLQEGSSVGGSALLMGDVIQASMAFDGSWCARGRDNSGTTTAAPDWAVRNGVLVAKTGDPVEGGTELWGDSIYAVAIDANGDWAVSGRTNSTDPAADDVVVLNGVVILREGDPIDLDGNGLFDDDAFIGRGNNTLAAFAANDLAVTDDSYVYAILELRNGAGVDRNDAGFGTPDAFVRLSFGAPAPVPLCFGDGSGTPCPCGNAGAPGNGCANSVVAAGGNIAATGTSNIGFDTLVLAGSGMPNSSALYFQGTSPLAGGAGSVFGDGLRCAGGTVIRLGTKFNVAGASQYPEGGDQSVSVRGLVVAPGTRIYQIWYRNAASFCMPDTFNLTNGLSVTWVP